jgi:hypothetical protein
MIDDDQLLLYHYHDGLSEREHRHIKEALAIDGALAQRYAALERDLQRFAAIVQQPAVSATARWREALDHVAEQGRRHPAWLCAPRFVLSGAAVSVLVVAGIVITQRQHNTNLPPPPLQHAVIAVESGDDGPRLNRNLYAQLARAEQQLMGIRSLKGDDRAKQIEQVRTELQIVALAAERAGDHRLARTVRAFAPIFELMHHTGRVDQADNPNGGLEGALAQLLFELRVVQAHLAAPQPIHLRPWAAL